MATIPTTVEDENIQRQPLDIAKEFFTTDDGLNIDLTKSNLSQQEVNLIALALWYGQRYKVKAMNAIIYNMLLLKRSKGALAFKYFRDSLKEMRPVFEQKAPQSTEIKP